jgi:hypothetical protein
MARGNQSDKNLRSKTEAPYEDLSDDAASGPLYDDDIDTEIAANQTGTPMGTAMRTKATPKTAAQQSTSMHTKKSNQPPNR